MDLQQDVMQVRGPLIRLVDLLLEVVHNKELTGFTEASRRYAKAVGKCTTKVHQLAPGG